MNLNPPQSTVANVAPSILFLGPGIRPVIPDRRGRLEVTIATPANALQSLNALASLAASAVCKNADKIARNLLCFGPANHDRNRFQAAPVMMANRPRPNPITL